MPLLYNPREAERLRELNRQHWLKQAWIMSEYVPGLGAIQVVKRPSTVRRLFKWGLGIGTTAYIIAKSLPGALERREYSNLRKK